MRKLLILLTLLLGVPQARAQDYAFGYNTCAAGLVASCVFKTAPGNLMALRVTNWGAAGVVFLVDSAAVPTSPSTIAPVWSFPIPVGTATVPTNVIQTLYSSGLLLTKGITALCSSTGISGGVPTHTASATCTFEAETR